VTFPAYSKLQHDVSRLRDAYLKVLQVTTFLSFLTTSLIFVLAHDFTNIFLGEKWLTMVPAMQVLVLSGLVRSIAATQGNLFYAMGKPEIDTILQAIRLAVLATLIYPLTLKLGIFGSSIAVLLSVLVSNIGFNFLAIKVTRCGVKQFGKMMVLPLINGIIVVMLIFTMKMKMHIDFFSFAILLSVGALIYFLIAYLLDKFFNYKIRILAKESFQLFGGT
jgi:O-antigen/teichoic acid export membrane protein